MAVEAHPHRSEIRSMHADGIQSTINCSAATIVLP